MKAAEARAIRKTLGCIKRCGAAGRHTHHRDCPNGGQWVDDDAPGAKVIPFRQREASVPVHELEELVIAWRMLSEIGAAIKTDSDEADGFEGGTRRCADDLQALIERVTP